MSALFSSGVGLRPVTKHWCLSRDGDEAGLALYHRHYSRRQYHDGREPKIFVGPGEKTVLVTLTGDALFVWRKFISGDGQQGINCAIFRNETSIRGSTLILEAEDVAGLRWGRGRLYTYVNAAKVRSCNPGCCFYKAGWNRCGVTKRGLLILEKMI